MIDSHLYGEDNVESVLLERQKIDGLYNISTQTMAKLITDKNLPYLIVDCRFDYEF